MRRVFAVIAISVLPLFTAGFALAYTSYSLINQPGYDFDHDKINDWKENYLYHTNATNADTDGDGVADYQELLNGTDPKGSGTLQKHIYISIQHQELRYYTGPYLVDDILVSTGVVGKDTPTGEFKVLSKIPEMLYQGEDYYLPNTKWSLLFLPSYYIHGAYWHNNFGHRMSHGCVNVSYADMPKLYEWADVGTPISIYSGDFPANLSFSVPNNTLLLDGGTIYLVMSGRKFGFTSMDAFLGLGYNMRKMKNRSSSGIPEGIVLNNPNMAHFSGSWVISNQTVYYVTDYGLVPIPSWDIFIANGGSGSVIVSANSNDLAGNVLAPMGYGDQRVIY